MSVCLPGEDHLHDARQGQRGVGADHEAAAAHLQVSLLLCFLFLHCCSLNCFFFGFFFFFSFFRTSDEVLSPEDYKQLLQCVYSSQRPLAAAAGELLFSR